MIIISDLLDFILCNTKSPCFDRDTLIEIIYIFLSVETFLKKGQTVEKAVY